MLMVLLALGASVPATAAETSVSLSGAAGFDFATRQPWAGLDLAFQPEQLKGFSFAGRVSAGWGFGDQRPLGVVQLGFAGVVPAEHMTVRLGLLAHSELYVVDYPLPIQAGTPVEGTFGKFGIFPGGLGLVELGWHRDAPKGPAAWAIGLRLGAAPVGVVIECPVQDAIAGTDLCVTSRVGMLGGFTGRLRFAEGAYLEATIGPSPTLSVGYAFLPKRHPAVVPVEAAQAPAPVPPAPAGESAAGEAPAP
jgi:hypothetical protein